VIDESSDGRCIGKLPEVVPDQEPFVSWEDRPLYYIASQAEDGLKKCIVTHYLATVAGIAFEARTGAKLWKPLASFLFSLTLLFFHLLC
jgi:hypothetical protein